MIPLSPPPLPLHSRMSTKTWARPSHLLPLLAAFKLWTASKGVLYPSIQLPQTRVSHSTEPLLDPYSGTFRVTDRANVSFLLMPQEGGGCGPNTTLVLLALSALTHRLERDTLRQSVGLREDVALVFLVADTTSMEGQQELEEEHGEHDDLVQVIPTIPSPHRPGL